MLATQHQILVTVPQPRDVTGVAKVPGVYIYNVLSEKFIASLFNRRSSRRLDIGQVHSITPSQWTVERFCFVGYCLLMLLGVQTTEECMLKHMAQRGILGSMA